MRGAMLLAAVAAALTLATPAGAATYEVAGKQKVVEGDPAAKMTGGLRGRWTTTSFEEVAFGPPYYEGKGTESFTGCIDRRRDRSCAGDPSGTLTFEFRFWGLFASPDPASEVWGACWHPVVGGTGAFAGAQGVVMFVDSPTPAGLSTRYIGSVTLKGGKSARRSLASAAPRTGC